MLLVVPTGVIDTAQRLIRTDRGEFGLREKEARILEVLGQEAGALVTRERLLTEVFEYSEASRSRTLVTTVGRTRQVLEQAGIAPDTLQTVYGQGYRWQAAQQAHQADPGLIGRHAELRILQELLDDPAARLVSLTGAGGIGKSTLARSVTRGRSDVRFVELAGHHDLASLQWAVLEAVGGLPNEPVPFALQHHGVDLLVLDNLEQLVPAARELLPAWLATHETLRIWCTTRRALHLDQEQCVPIGPMPVDDARALFLKRTPQPVHGGEQHLEPILEALEWHPLSIELAAARCLVFSLETLRERLEAGHDLLRSTRGHPQRHASAEQVVHDSLALLEPDALDALSQLTVFADAFTLARVLAVVQVDGRPPEDLLQVLVEHHLIARLDGSRFRIHNVVRATVTPNEPTAAVRDAARRFIRVVAEEAALQEADGLQRLVDGEVLEVLPLAIAHQEPERAAIVLHAALHRFERAHPPEMLRPFVEALGASTGLDPVTTARIRTAEAWLARLRDPDNALPAAERAVRAARACRDDLLIAASLEQRAQVLAVVHQPDACQRDLTETAFRHRAAGRDFGVVATGLLEAVTNVRLWNMDAAQAALSAIASEVATADFEQRFRYEQVSNAVANESSRWEDARRSAQRLMRLAEQGTAEHRAWALLELGFAQGCTGDLQGVREMMEEALDLASQSWLVIRLMCNVYGMLARERRWSEAQEQCTRCLVKARRAGGRAERLSLLRAGWLARLSGDLELAERYHRRASPDDVAHISDLTEQALLFAQAGDLPQALAAQQQLVDRLGPSGRTSERMRAACLLAELELARGAWATAEALVAPFEHRHDVQPYERPRLEVITMAARGTPGPVPQAPDPHSALDYACWVAVAHRRAGDPQQADALLAEVRQALKDDGLPATSELGWRLRVAGG